jgi:glycosyltransferase involved in cell wall biosynthesis
LITTKLDDSTAGARPRTPTAGHAAATDEARGRAGARPRVGYLINHYPKVSHTFIRREILGLEKQGFDVFRMAVRGWDDPAPDPVDQIEKGKTRYLLKDGMGRLLKASVAMALSSPGRFLSALKLALKMSRGGDRPWPYHLIYLAEACVAVPMLRAAGVSHLHAHFATNPAELAALIAELGGPSYSVMVHGSEEFDRPASLYLGEKIHRARFVTAITSFCRSQLFRWCDPADWDKIQIVRCGLDPEFHQVEAPAPRGHRMVAVGRMSEQKGYLLLIEAAARVAARVPDFELVLAGDGEQRALIEASIARHGLQRQVRITGWVSSARVREEILGARAMVVSSFAEGLPVVMMEAMALGRPCVSSCIAGIPELVTNGENGWLVPAGDAQALADAMVACLTLDDAELTRVGQAARATALARHDIDREAARLAELLHEHVFSKERAHA